MPKNSHLSNVDMTNGNILQKLLLFTWPLMVGYLFQQSYQIVDSVIVGHKIGPVALAAVGVYTPIYNLLLSLFTGISSGATVVVSQYYGAKNGEKLNKAVYMALFLTLIIGLAITIIGVATAPFLLRLIRTPDEIFDMALLFTRVMFSGIIPILLYNMLGGVLRGMGDSIMPLVYLIVANLINIILVYLFVAVFSYGIQGAAFATIISQTVAAIACLAYLLQSQKKYDLDLRNTKIDWNIGKKLFSIGLPAGLQSSVFSIGFLLQQNLINSFGPAVIAAYVVVQRVDSLALIPMNSFNVAITTFVGQNIGAKQIQRAKDGIRNAMSVCIMMTSLIVLFLFFRCETLMKWFTSDPDVIQTGIIIFRTLSIGYITVIPNYILSGAIRGAGDSVAPFISSLFCNVIFRSVFSYLLVYFFGTYRVIFISVASAWTLCSIFMTIYYFKGKWQEKYANLFR